MATYGYKGWWIHEMFLHPSQMTVHMINGVTVQSPDGDIIRVKSFHAAKCLITRRSSKDQL